jgi:hypothetical protein
VLKGKRGKGTFSPGGRFSLGRMTSGSGYCIGIVVESRMGTGTSIRSETGNMGFETSMEGGNGLEDVWIVGEPFFRDVQVAFNVSLTPGLSRDKANEFISGTRRRLVCKEYDGYVNERGDFSKIISCLS